MKYFSITTANGTRINGDHKSCSISVVRKNFCSSWKDSYCVRRTNRGNVQLMFPTSGPQTWDNTPMDGVIIACDYNKHNLKVLAQVLEQNILEEANLPIIGKVEKYWITKVSEGGWPIIPSLQTRIIPINNKKK